MRISKSGLLSVVVEPDPEAPDDKTAWVLLGACAGPKPPKRLRGGYLHPKDCACRGPFNTLCDVGWLEEFVRSAGVYPLVRRIAEIEDQAAKEIDGPASTRPIRLHLAGRLVSESFSCDYGTDYDEHFEAEQAEVFVDLKLGGARK